MLKKPLVIFFFVVLALIAFLVYMQVKIPDGVIPQSDAQVETIAWLSLWTAIISLLTSIIGLFQNIIEKDQREK